MLDWSRSALRAAASVSPPLALSGEIAPELVDHAGGVVDPLAVSRRRDGGPASSAATGECRHAHTAAVAADHRMRPQSLCLQESADLTAAKISVSNE